MANSVSLFRMVSHVSTQGVRTVSMLKEQARPAGAVMLYAYNDCPLQSDPPDFVLLPLDERYFEPELELLYPLDCIVPEARSERRLFVPS